MIPVANPVRRTGGPALARLGALHPLDPAAEAAIAVATETTRVVKPRREILGEGEPIPRALLIAQGWAARTRVLEDGRRQIMNFLLPGDLIGSHDQLRPLSPAAVVAITDMEVCPAPSAAVSPALAQAYAHGRALDEAYLLAQITRLGRLDAHERIVDLLLELLERLDRAGLATEGRFHMPLTQEVIADALGLTSVHVNRMLQTLRREGRIEWKGREVVIPDPLALRRYVGRQQMRVQAGEEG